MEPEGPPFAPRDVDLVDRVRRETVVRPLKTCSAFSCGFVFVSGSGFEWSTYVLRGRGRYVDSVDLSKNIQEHLDIQRPTAAGCHRPVGRQTHRRCLMVLA